MSSVSLERMQSTKHSLDFERLIQSQYAIVLNARFHHQDHLDFIKHLNYLLDELFAGCLKAVFMFNFLKVNNEGMCS